MGDLSDESEDGLSISPHDSGKKTVFDIMWHLFMSVTIFI